MRERGGATSVVIGLGSNLGHREGHLREALTYLTRRHHHLYGAPPLFDLECCSSIYESQALLPPNAPPSWNTPFLNMACMGKTLRSPQALLDALKVIEQHLGRKSRDRWAPREIDLDILAFGNVVVNTDSLTVPHPGLTQRSFALIPLAECAPDWIHPLNSRTAQSLAAELSCDDLEKSDIDAHTLLAPQLVGIVNVTPDSFSDGGLDPFERTECLTNEGADVIDIGAESTRPGAAAVDPTAEWLRLDPVLRRIRESSSNPPTVSIDTRHHQVATQALAHGADWINDVTGFSTPQMCDAVVASSCRCVVMHSIGVPPRKDRVLDESADPVEQLKIFAAERFESLATHGITTDRLIFDPGIGFGKSAEQSLEILSRASELQTLGVPILIGHSRKSFLSLFSEKPPQARDPETLALSVKLARQGIDYLRIHNVDLHRRVFNALGHVSSFACGIHHKRKYHGIEVM